VNKTQTAIGSVVSLWRYPVKSMLAEELNSSYVTERGLMGDRAYALIDKETGKVANAKNPRKWEKLFDFHSVLGYIHRRTLFRPGTTSKVKLCRP
jgi:uncharacterized protein